MFEVRGWRQFLERRWLAPGSRESGSGSVVHRMTPRRTRCTIATWMKIERVVRCGSFTVVSVFFVRVSCFVFGINPIGMMLWLR